MRKSIQMRGSCDRHRRWSKYGRPQGRGRIKRNLNAASVVAVFPYVDSSEESVVEHGKKERGTEDVGHAQVSNEMRRDEVVVQFMNNNVDEQRKIGNG